MKRDNADSCCELTFGEVHAWRFTLDLAQEDIDAWARLLSADERERAQRFRQKQDRLLFTARRGLLRQLISRYTGMDPLQISYTVNPHGKPGLPGGTLHFNLSHSRNQALFAFAADMETGIDIEQVRPLPDMEDVCRQWFSETEQQALMRLPQAQHLAAFYHIWTQKEAFIKARGLGLSLPLPDFSVAADPTQPGRMLAIRGEDAGEWQMVKLAAEPGCQAALCLQSSQPVEVKWMTRTPPPDSPV